MSRVRVDPEQLLRSGQSIGAAAARLREVGAQLESQAATAPDYGGQFGPRVRAMAGEGRALATAAAERLEVLARRLGQHAADFARAEAAALAALGRVPDPAPVFSAYARRPDGDLDLEESYWLGLRAGRVPATKADWEAAASRSGLSLAEYLARSLGLPRATATAMAGLAFTETKEVGLPGVVLVIGTLLNRLQPGMGAISAGQYHALGEIVALRPGLFAGMKSANGTTLLQHLAAAPAGQALLAQCSDEFLRGALSGSAYRRYKERLDSAAPGEPVDPWQALADTGALDEVLRYLARQPDTTLAADVRAVISTFAHGLDVRTSGPYLAGLAAYSTQLGAGQVDHRMVIRQDVVTIGSNLSELASNDLEAIAARVRAQVLQWFGLPDNNLALPDCTVEQNGNMTQVSFVIPSLGQKVIFQMAQDGTRENLQITLPGGRSRMAQRAAEMSLLVIAGQRLGDPAMFLPPDQHMPGLADALRQVSASGATFEANPDPAWVQMVEVYDPFRDEMRDMPAYAAQLMDDAAAFKARADALELTANPDPQTLRQLRFEAERRREAADSLVSLLGPDEDYALVVLAGMWPYIGGKPSFPPPPP